VADSHVITESCGDEDDAMDEERDQVVDSSSQMMKITKASIYRVPL
jgi:hypothetical protein